MAEGKRRMIATGQRGKPDSNLDDAAAIKNSKNHTTRSISLRQNNNKTNVISTLTR